MSLLRDIQNSAVDSNESIGTLLRKCKILAARLGDSEFKAWVENELNGYYKRESLPEYRIFKVTCKGNFSGGYGSSLNNAEIPMGCIPKELREGLSTSHLAQPISSIESLINDSDSGTAQEPWPPDVTVHCGENIYRGMNCLEAWKVIPINTLVGILDMIRSKVLNFVLEIEAVDPEAGDAPLNSKPVAKEKVQQIFHTYISGNVQNVATGSSGFEQNATINEHNELFNKLLESLTTAGADEKITGVVEDMRDSQDISSFSSHYKKFMGLLADHMQVYGSVVAPFLPALAAMMP